MSRISFDIEEYIKDMPPQLQQAARNCTTKEELMELANENDVELSMEALELVSGGCGTDDISDEDKNNLLIGNDIFC